MLELRSCILLSLALSPYWSRGSLGRYGGSRSSSSSLWCSYSVFTK